MSTLKLKGSSSGEAQVTVAAAAGTPTITLPTANINLATDGSDGQFLKTNGSGTLSFATVTAGLTEADQWRVNANFSSADTIITSNWERVDARGSAGPLGTGFDPPSSGVFTFPATGYWLVTFNTWCAGTSADWVEMSIHACLDGASYNTVSTTRDSCEDGDSHVSMSTEALIDVTSTSDVKVKFDVKAASSIEWYGDTQLSETNVVFLKLGDT